jgi:hypothetical protein
MLYHKNTGMPKIEIQKTKIKPRYSIHAMDSAENDFYDIIELPAVVDLANADIFEIETDNKKIVKIAFRIAYNEEFDLCIAMLIPSNKVKTVWLNSVDDQHETLKKERYDY